MEDYTCKFIFQYGFNGNKESDSKNLLHLLTKSILSYTLPTEKFLLKYFINK